MKRESTEIGKLNILCSVYTIHYSRGLRNAKEERGRVYLSLSLSLTYSLTHTQEDCERMCLHHAIFKLNTLQQYYLHSAFGAQVGPPVGQSGATRREENRREERKRGYLFHAVYERTPCGGSWRVASRRVE